MKCAEFEYDNVPGSRDEIRDRFAPRLRDLVTRRLDNDKEIRDGRTTHAVVFLGFAPAAHPRYVGNYRGDPLCPCLREYVVGIPSDRRVGYPPSEVHAAMAEFVVRVGKSVRVLDLAQGVREPAANKLYTIVVVACRLFEEFLRIHPYANGNGHMARWLVCALLARYGHATKRWTVEPRPPDPPYSVLIANARDGDLQSLEQYVMELLKD